MTDFVKPIIFYQDDRRWANSMYSCHNDKHQTMRTSGSGPTLMADIVATLIDPSVTPLDMAQLAIEWGDRTHTSGTSWSYFKHVFMHYNQFDKFIESCDYSKMTDCLDHGGYVICNLCDFDCHRNYYLAWKYDDSYVYCISAQKIRKYDKVSCERFKASCRRYFCFYPKNETTDD